MRNESLNYKLKKKQKWTDLQSKFENKTES